MYDHKEALYNAIFTHGRAHGYLSVISFKTKLYLLK